MIVGVAAGAALAAAAGSGDIVGAARAQSAPKTFLLVPGAFSALNAREPPGVPSGSRVA